MAVSSVGDADQTEESEVEGGGEEDRLLRPRPSRQGMPMLQMHLLTNAIALSRDIPIFLATLSGFNLPSVSRAPSSTLSSTMAVKHSDAPISFKTEDKTCVLAASCASSLLFIVSMSETGEGMRAELEGRIRVERLCSVDSNVGLQCVT